MSAFDFVNALLNNPPGSEPLAERDRRSAHIFLYGYRAIVLHDHDFHLAHHRGMRKAMSAMPLDPSGGAYLHMCS